MKLLAFPIQPLPHFSAKYFFTSGKVLRDPKGAANVHNLL